MIILKDIMHTEPLPHDFTCESHLCTAHYNYTFPGSIFCGFQRCGPVAKHCASPPFRFHPRARTNPCVLAHTRAAPPGGGKFSARVGNSVVYPVPPPRSAVGVVAAGRRQPAAARRLLLRGFLGVKAPGSSTRNYCRTPPLAGRVRQWERSADDWPGGPRGRRTVECNAWIPAAWLGNSIPIIMPAWGFLF